jgi:hypothetical protein
VEVIMQRFASLLLAVALGFTTNGLAQQAQEPAEPGAVPRPGVAESMVRFVNVSPNADVIRIMLVDGNGVAAHESVEVGYLETTEYMPVFEGSYDVVVETAGVDGAEVTQRVLEEGLGYSPGLYYTIAIIGLVMPEDETDRDEGFFAWLQDLFTDDRPELGLRAVKLDDLTTHAGRVGNVEVRLLHAAPGTDDVDLVIVHEGSVGVLGTASYGDVTNYDDYPPGAGTLQIRASGSDLVIVDLQDVDLSEDMIHTVILAGTPIEDVPLEAVVLSGEWFDPLLVGPGVAGMPGAMTPEATTWVLDYVLAAEARLDAAEQRLAALAEVGEAQEAASSAVEEIRQARELLHEARFQLEAVTAPGAVPPTAPGVTPVEPAPPAEEPAEPADEPAEPEEQTEEEPAPAN